MINKVDDFYGYNDTISALISKMSLAAYEKFDKEKMSGQNDRVAMARAIGDTVKENICIFTQYYSMDRDLINHGYKDKDGYIKHIEKATFLKFAESIFESNNYRVEKFNNVYEYKFKYQLALFNIGELKERGEWMLS